MAYWWANQIENYPAAIEEGSLWTCPRAYGKPLGQGRAYIHELRKGDIVFHYSEKHIRAVSVVIQEVVDFPRSAAYFEKDGEGDAGFLVRVQVLHKDLELHFKEVAKIIHIGMPGPINKSLRPQQGRFLSALTAEDGPRLLSRLKVVLPQISDDGFLGRSPEFWSGESTDEFAFTKLRKEQGDLRKGLLNGRTIAPCDICGRHFPTQLLIAGHIKPRSRCTDEERRNHKAAAMIVCTLGCDALFEWGYLVVLADGNIHASRVAETVHLQNELDLLLGRRCGAYNSDTAEGFAAHADLHSI